MFPFVLQARLVEAWLGASAAGFAMAGAMGATAARGLEAWAPGARRGAAEHVWGPWPWFAGFGTPPTTYWWQVPTSFSAPSSVFLGPMGAWSGGFPIPAWYGFFPPALRPLTFFPTQADPTALFAATYRTASGHATATMFDALMPQTGHWSTAAWKLSPAWMFVR